MPSNVVPFYHYSLEDAKEYGEMDMWRESHKANIDCATYFENEIKNNFKNNHLSGLIAKNAINKFGYDRVNFILRVNLLQRKNDGRISDENHKWAKSEYVQKSNLRDEYLIDSHTELLNGVVDQAKKEWKSLGLYDSKITLDDDQYANKLLIIKPAILAEEYRTPDNQLFYATAGFGCDPGSLGRQVYGVFLSDGERTSFSRNEFLGVADESQLPEWVTNRKNEIIESLNEQGSTPSPNPTDNISLN